MTIISFLQLLALNYKVYHIMKSCSVAHKSQSKKTARQCPIAEKSSILFVDMLLFHFSHRNQPEVTQYLLSKGAKKNAVNQGHCSCLHVAVNKSYTECVRILLRHKCDVNLQVSFHFERFLTFERFFKNHWTEGQKIIKSTGCMHWVCQNTQKRTPHQGIDKQGKQLGPFYSDTALSAAISYFRTLCAFLRSLSTPRT